MSKSLVYFQWPSWIFWHFRLLRLRIGVHFPLCLRLHPGRRPVAWQTKNSQSYQRRPPRKSLLWSSDWGSAPTTNNYWSTGDSQPPERSHCKVWEQRSAKIYLDIFIKIPFTTITEAFFFLFDYIIKGRYRVFYPKFIVKDFSIFRIIDFFDYGQILQTLIFTLGFLSIVNIVVSISVGTWNNLENSEEGQSAPEGRQLDIMTQVFDAIDVMEQKYFNVK